MSDNESVDDKVISREELAFPPCWRWSRVIPDYLFQCLEHEFKDIPTVKGGTYSSPGGIEKEQDREIRDTDVMMFDPIHWFCGILFNYGMAANQLAGWNMSVIAPECLQISLYGPEQHYTWHPDSDLLFKTPVIRKISVITMISDRSEYTGGALELDGLGEIILERGDVIVFPSWIKHRVTPVEKGLRKTAVTWISGYRSL